MSEGVILTCLLLFDWYSEGLDWAHCLPIPEPDQWIRIQDQFRIRIRLQDGYMEQEHGSILLGEDPDPWPSPARIMPDSPPNRNYYSKQIKLNWRFKLLQF